MSQTILFQLPVQKLSNRVKQKDVHTFCTFTENWYFQKLVTQNKMFHESRLIKHFIHESRLSQKLY